MPACSFHRLEVSERMQQERARVEDQISAKLDAEMQALLQFKQQVMQGQARSSTPGEGMAPGPSQLQQQGPSALSESHPTSPARPLDLSVGISSNSAVVGTATATGGTWELGRQASAPLTGMSVSDVRLEPTQKGDGSISLNLQITFIPMLGRIGESEAPGSIEI